LVELVNEDIVRQMTKPGSMGICIHSDEGREIDMRPYHPRDEAKLGGYDYKVTPPLEVEQSAMSCAGYMGQRAVDVSEVKRHRR
jgi:hypothetical protein